MKTTWKPVAAGIIDIMVGVFTLLLTFIMVAILVGIGGSILTISRIADLMPIWLSGFVEGTMVIIGILLIVFSALPLLGGAYAVQRENWGWALAGSIVAIFSSAILGIVSTVLVFLSKNEFKKYDRF
ncbi:hypothetical protein ACFLWG_01770 [Chloroflexota bacterium]